MASICETSARFPGRRQDERDSNASTGNTADNVLIVEDELRLRRTIRTILVARGYQVWGARTGNEALDLIRSEKVDLVLLDINLPDMTGLRVCREIRAGSNVPVLILTVLDSEEDKVAAFDVGADDYLVKPFKASELLARIRAHLRRQSAGEPEIDIFRFDDCAIDFVRRSITRKGEVVSLSPKQFQLLRYMVKHRDKPLSHCALLQAVWGADYGEECNLLHSSVAQLRKKVEPEPNNPKYIVTVPWFGYRFIAANEQG